jgi:hypothetical protein
MRRNARRFVEFFARPLRRHFATGLLLGMQAGESARQAQQHFVDVAFAHSQRR